MSTVPTTTVMTPSPPAPLPQGARVGDAQYYWLWVLCLLGLDYFSTLAYQPSITYHETGMLGPLATAAVVLVTLFGALPVYCYLAGRSPGGQGSLGVVEKLIRGWRGKTIVLILLGFAATDFTMLKSLSLADASVHVLNKHDGERLKSAKLAAGWMKECADEYCGNDVAQYVDEQLLVTIVLGIVSFVFWFLLRKGFNRKVMLLAVPLIGLYLLLTGILIGAGLWRLYEQPDVVTTWLERIQHGELRIGRFPDGEDGWTIVVLFSLLALPKLALGLSGFELSMILMPQVEGKPGEHPPRTRIRNTRKVLIAAALIMSVYLVGSVFITALLIPPAAFDADGLANNRALAYLAHGGKLTIDGPLAPMCGVIFGTTYDTVTVLILCLAGTSVMTALAVLLPQFLLRFGMELRWADRWGVLLVIFAGINMAVTIFFKANVEDQRGAYATGVLVLMACAAVVAVLSMRREHEQTAGPRGIFYYLGFAFHTLVAAVFVTTMLAVAMRSPSGLGIALCFIAAVLAMSIASRAWRADELRTIGFDFKDEQSKFLWDNLRLQDFPVLAPARPGRENHAAKEAQLREEHQLSPESDIVFVEVTIGDASDFFQSLLIEVVREDTNPLTPNPSPPEGRGETGYRFTIKVTNCVSVAHALAAVAMEMSRHSKPPLLIFGWPEQNMLSASWSYLAFGEGNIPWKVRELICHAEKDPAKRPRVIVG